MSGDKLSEHEGYCGSKTRKCNLCNQNITLREFEAHKVDGTCKFYQEVESDKAMRELAKFQDEEMKKFEDK